ncbi:PepSY domain-containing protein [Croceicoccus pelagius]|uniref:PepSY domain-containing protein n=1 Tax=Croceicoccus pelagius TaxID=1703341 RepID=A0A916YAQ1_9SPHN|nr:PepSY domain-containing protein [Croceicoccus pelagius]GGD38118.1 hypothetical protein GCM10010989_10300 [Croceicoccus pelagius]
MKRIRFTPLFFRRVHKWVGLVLGIQFILWSVSGAMMAFIDMKDVRDQPMIAADPVSVPGLLAPTDIGIGKVESLKLSMADGRPIYEIGESGSVRIVDGLTGDPVVVDEALVRQRAAVIVDAPIRSISLMNKPNLEAREFAGPMWRVDFDDAEGTSAYFAADTGRFLVARGDDWRLWDFFWMLHNMDYADRTSFNHPLIIVVGFGVLFLSGTGFYLLFKSFNRRDFRWLVRRKPSFDKTATAQRT